MRIRDFYTRVRFRAANYQINNADGAVEDYFYISQSKHGPFGNF